MMRAILKIALVVFLILSLSVRIGAQTNSDIPSEVDEIPGYRGLYVDNALKFLTGAIFGSLLTQPDDVRGFLSNVKLCASDARVLRRLRGEGLSSAAVSLREAPIALQRGYCEIYVSSRFNFAVLDQRFDNEAPPVNPDRPPQNTDSDQNDDVEVDRSPPRIVPARPVFAGTGLTIEVRATITDAQSGVRSAAVVYSSGAQVAMRATGDAATYTATVNLPRSYDDETVAIVATNTAGRSVREVVSLRLQPWCGPRVPVSSEIVRSVQEGLSCVGSSPGASDGALGPNTCRGIAAFLGQRMEVFNAGRMSWAQLRDDVARACDATKPVVLDVPPVLERDSDNISLRIGLAEAGATQSIRIIGPDDAERILDWQGRPLRLALPMPRPGAVVRYRVEALGTNNEVLSRAPLRLVRPAAAMTVSPTGDISVDQDQLTFTVTINRGASAIARIEAQPPQAPAIARPFEGDPLALIIPAPRPGTSGDITFVAFDRGGNALAEETVSVTRPAAVLPPRITLDSPDGLVLDAEIVRLVIGLENPESVEEVRLMGGAPMVELARRSSGTGRWETRQPMPAPGQTRAFRAEAVGRSGKVLAQSEVSLERAGVRLDVWPTGRFEADSEGVTALVGVLRGADWIESIVARSVVAGQTRELLQQAAVETQQVRLALSMPPAGHEQVVEIVAIGRDGQAYAPVKFVLARPAAALPIELRVTSPDGFAVDAASTRLAVQVVNPAQTDVILISDSESGEVITRAAFDGEGWSGEVIMPDPGDDRLLVVEAQDTSGTTLASSQIMLVRPVISSPLAAVPQWVWIVLIALVSLIMGYLIAQLKRRPPVDTQTETFRPVAARLHIKAEPDKDPMLALDPESPPAFVIRIEQDETPETIVEMQAEPEEVK